MWKEIAGTDGQYWVSDEGQIWSGLSQRLLKTPAGAGGYQIVTVGKRGCQTVHRLVAEAFIGPIPAGYLVCHRDGNPGNNRAANLRIDTAKGNHADRVLHGTHERGETSVCAKLTDQQIVEIRASSGLTHKALARQYGVSRSYIGSIINGRVRVYG